jgi:hypothetical protein
MPTPMQITGRSSHITNSFINAIIPVMPPTADQVEKARSLDVRSNGGLGVLIALSKETA